ncbi:MAG: hypothetical protein EAZ36_05110 [Verrucomicrobia bacterium]|nr:MAG: hypothetical protein EAZ36_05110 [Verrucomicrobiota bacterium]
MRVCLVACPPNRGNLNSVKNLAPATEVAVYFCDPHGPYHRARGREISADASFSKAHFLLESFMPLHKKIVH